MRVSRKIRPFSRPAARGRYIASASYISQRVISRYLEGSMVAFHAEYLDEVMVAEQGDP
jgi:hypothetical protein